jgi:hypothetical protein
MPRAKTKVESGEDQMRATEAEHLRFVVIAAGSGGGVPDGVKAWLECWCSTRAEDQGTFVVVLSVHPGCADARWPDYGYLETKTSGCGLRFVVYASGWYPENDGSFCLADARRLTSTGLVAVESFHEASELGRPGASK